MAATATQFGFEQLGTPLFETTFVVLDMPPAKPGASWPLMCIPRLGAPAVNDAQGAAV